ncbi:radical SAM protein [Clostridia bacterium]|nr:radical SAM protein [Clostridia bacterium]
MKSTRTELYKVLPLANPFLVQIFPSYACNFKCEYCLHSLPRSEHGFISNVTHMDFELYKHAIDDMANAGWKLKMLRFAALGEPLLHPKIAKMVKYAVDAKIADTVDIVTNASLLTEKLSDALISAGLSTLRISLEGLCSEDYRKSCGADVDFERLRSSIEYFYKHCNDTEVYVKIIDYMLEGDSGRERRFNEMFAPISHRIAVEHLTPTVENIDYSQISNDSEHSLTQGGTELLPVNICPQPFYMMQINPDGNIVPCCATAYPIILGNTKTDGAANVWNGREFTEFRRKMLSGTSGLEVCDKCTLYRYGVFREDVLDGHEDDLREKYASYFRNE